MLLKAPKRHHHSDLRSGRETTKRARRTRHPERANLHGVPHALAMLTASSSDR